jgi:hypothetical protein
MWTVNKIGRLRACTSTRNKYCVGAGNPQLSDNIIRNFFTSLLSMHFHLKKETENKSNAILL